MLMSQIEKATLGYFLPWTLAAIGAALPYPCLKKERKKEKQNQTNSN